MGSASFTHKTLSFLSPSGALSGRETSVQSLHKVLVILAVPIHDVVFFLCIVVEGPQVVVLGGVVGSRHGTVCVLW